MDRVTPAVAFDVTGVHPAGAVTDVAWFPPPVVKLTSSRYHGFTSKFWNATCTIPVPAGAVYVEVHCVNAVGESVNAGVVAAPRYVQLLS